MLLSAATTPTTQQRSSSAQLPAAAVYKQQQRRKVRRLLPPPLARFGGFHLQTLIRVVSTRRQATIKRQAFPRTPPLRLPQAARMGENAAAVDASLSEFLAIAVDAAKSAGEIIRQGFYQTKHVEHKGQVDLVTETDKACEELIFNQIKKHFPEHKFIGEETSAVFGTDELTDHPTWIVDPLDGTTNFVHGFPFVCVSIGLTIGKVPTIGVVYNPIIGELFTGVQGQGAFLNGAPIKVSSQDQLVKALLVTEAGTKRDKSTLDAMTNRINNLLSKVRSIRMCGSLALNLCGIACGRLDLGYEIGFGGPWDVAAGAVILHEAGGFVFDPSGGDFDIMSRRAAASNSHLKDAFISALRETDE